MADEVETYCLTCPACAMKVKEREAVEGQRCLICLDWFADPGVRRSDRDGVCGRCASALPATGLGDQWGRGRK
jgi:hypothetical protein